LDAKREIRLFARRDGARGEKIARIESIFSRGGGCSRREGQTGQRPVMGDAATFDRTPLRSRSFRSVRDENGKGREGNRIREKRVRSVERGESPRDRKLKRARGLALV